MEENNDRLKAAGERVRSKIDASSGVAMPQETFEVEESIRQSNGSILRTSPVDDARKPKRRVTRMSRKRYRKRNSAYVVLVLFFAAVIGFSVWMIVRNKKAEATPVPAESEAAAELKKPLRLPANMPSRTVRAARIAMGSHMTGPPSLLRSGSTASLPGKKPRMVMGSR